LTITPYFGGTTVSGTITGLEYTDDTPVNGYVKVKIAVNIPGYPGYNGEELVQLEFNNGQASFSVDFDGMAYWYLNPNQVNVTIVTDSE
jgi:hypothetical protein